MSGKGRNKEVAMLSVNIEKHIKSIFVIIGFQVSLFLLKHSSLKICDGESSLVNNTIWLLTIIGGCSVFSGIYKLLRWYFGDNLNGTKPHSD
jgi:hypothetical protein